MSSLLTNQPHKLIPQEHTILIIEDNPADLGLIAEYLVKCGFGIMVAQDGESAIEQLRDEQPDLILLNVIMPGIDGFETCRRLKANESTQAIPVIFMTTQAAVEDKVKGFEVGAVDYITKPIQPAEVLARVTIHLQIGRLTHKLQDQNKRLQSIAREFVEANDALSKRAIQLDISNKVAQQMTSILDLDKLLAAVVALIQQEFGYYFVGIWVLTEQKSSPPQNPADYGKFYYIGDIVVLHAQAASPEVTLPVQKTISLETSEDIIAWVCKTGKPYLAEDVKSDPKYVAWSELPDSCSAFAIPLGVGKRIVGVLDIKSNLKDSFDPDDRVVLQTLASQISVAIRNAQLYESEQRRRYLLERLDKTKSDFIKVTSHELRTPLTVVKGYTQVLNVLPAIKDDPNASELLHGVINGVDRLYEVVNTMLDVVKIDTHVLEMHRKPTTLANIIGKVKRRIKEDAKERQLTLNISELEGLPILQADADLLFKVFYHLILNAVKYTPDGGTITVTGQTVQRSTGNSAIKVTISDTGIGIDPAHHQQIFEKFYQTGKVELHSSSLSKFKGGGPGLGLAIVRGIVLAHGGEVWVESEGHNEQTCPGSHFHVILPLHQEIELGENLPK